MNFVIPLSSILIKHENIIPHLVLKHLLQVDLFRQTFRDHQHFLHDFNKDPEENSNYHKSRHIERHD